MDSERRDGYLGFTLLCLVASLIAGLVAALAGPGSQVGLWHFRTGFAILKWAALGGLAAALASLVGLILSLRAGRISVLAGALGVLIGSTTFLVPLGIWKEAKELPAIHDITTDIEDPPQFVALLEERKHGQNPSEYGGPDVAMKQKSAYPDICPVVIQAGMDEAFQRAIDAAHRLGWSVVETRKEEGRIEATDTTFWFGFKDDVVVRLTPLGPASTRVDIRSVSRVGKSDVGANAKRIRRYVKILIK